MNIIKVINNKIKIIFKKHNLNTEEGRSLEREKRIYLTAFAAAISKVITTLTPLITAKITLSYFGEELYGLWAAITSFFAFFAFADLGLGNGLQTELSRASGKEGNETYCQELIANTFFMLTAVSFILIILLLILNPLIDWVNIMNAQSDITRQYIVTFVLAIFLSKLMNIPLSIANRTQNALQSGYIGNIFSCIGSISTLIAIFVISKLNFGISIMIWCSSLVTVVTSLFNLVLYFGFIEKDLRPKLKFFNFSILKKLLKIGMVFLILSILTSISLTIDNYIVGKTISLSDATPYSLAYKMALTISVVSNMFSTPLWSAFGEAIERGDIKWAKKQAYKMSLISFIFSSGITIFLIVCANFILNWLKPGMRISLITLLFMCGTQILISIINPFFMVLNANRNIFVQIILYSIFSLISLPLKFIFGLSFGQIGIAAVGFFSYLVIIVPFTYFYSMKIVDKLSINMRRKT